MNEKNCGEHSAAPFVHAIGGSWVCTKADIAAHNFEKITQLCKAARAAILGFEVGHVGVNCKDDAEAQAVCDKLTDAFSFPAEIGNSSNFSTDAIEVMKGCGRGVNGHIAIRTNKVSNLPSVRCRSGVASSEGLYQYICIFLLGTDSGGYC